MWMSRIQIAGLSGSGNEPMTIASERLATVEDPRWRIGLRAWMGALRPTALGWAAQAIGPVATVEENRIEFSGVVLGLDEVVHPRITVEVDLQVDASMFMRLREHAVREPSWIEGLADRLLTIRVDWLFDESRTIATTSLAGVALGKQKIPLSDVPTWMPDWLDGLASRVRFVDSERLDGESMARDALGTDPEARKRANALLDAHSVTLVRDGSLYRLATQDLAPIAWRSRVEREKLSCALASNADVWVAADTRISDEWFQQQLDEGVVEQVLR